MKFEGVQSSALTLLERSRFRSGRFGGGRAAGELVLYCQSCPVYHLDGLIVLQSQLSSLENCVDLHCKEASDASLPLEHWNQTFGDNGIITLLLSFLRHTHGYWLVSTLAYSNRVFTECSKVGTHLNTSPWGPESISPVLTAKNSLTDFFLTFSPSHQ